MSKNYLDGTKITHTYKSYISKKRMGKRFKSFALVGATLLSAIGIWQSITSFQKAKEYGDLIQDSKQTIEQLKGGDESFFSHEVQLEEEKIYNFKLKKGLLIASGVAEGTLSVIILALYEYINERIKKSSSKQEYEFYERFLKEITPYSKEEYQSKLQASISQVLNRIVEVENVSEEEIMRKIKSKEIFSDIGTSYLSMFSYIIEYFEEHPDFEEKNARVCQNLPRLQMEFFNYINKLGYNPDSFLNLDYLQTLSIFEEFLESQLKKQNEKKILLKTTSKEI